MSRYAEIKHLVGGEIERTELVLDQKGVDDYINMVRREVAADRIPTKVTVQWHEHDFHEDCYQCDRSEHLTIAWSP